MMIGNKVEGIGMRKEDQGLIEGGIKPRENVGSLWSGEQDGITRQTEIGSRSPRSNVNVTVR